ncbi:hypothetical protein P2L35_12750 [Enterococcus faecium]|uniref:hypothetical protein n=1 Tax=Enterococcus faecium TaxID=1352 RepID=UPI0025B061E0|nr:hypothetical protein [Enterococcus faecium]MDN3040561.1 hypothetical protein [Enterococcus faecium]
MDELIGDCAPGWELDDPPYLKPLGFTSLTAQELIASGRAPMLRVTAEHNMVNNHPVYSATEVNRLLQYAQRMRDLADRLQARTRHIVQRESI